MGSFSKPLMKLSKSDLDRLGTFIDARFLEDAADFGRSRRISFSTSWLAVDSLRNDVDRDNEPLVSNVESSERESFIDGDALGNS
jgi:hypothetical protein